MADTFPIYKTPTWIKDYGILPPSQPQHFSMLANRLIPFMAPVEQQAIATFAGNDPASQTHFSSYKGPLEAGETPRLTTSVRETMLSSDRARQALENLRAHMRGSGMTTDESMGPGFQFLTKALGLLEQFGGREGEAMTRAGYEQLQSNLEAILSQAQSDRSLAPYADLAQKFINPTVMGGSLMPTTNLGGRTIYGQASGQLFR